MSGKVAVIIGAGPAGLTAAYEMLTRTDIKPIVIEKSEYMGGLSRTENYKGNRIDIGGHRFFSKSERVMQWWFEMLPLQTTNGEEIELAYQGKRRKIQTSASETDPRLEDRVMLVRHRVSRIYFLRKFFNYPISLSLDTLSKLGPVRVLRIVSSYLRSLLFPIREERNLEQFFINRFGRELYRTFFKSYTEKVWGTPCSQISAAWGAQRIKGLSVAKTVSHFIKSRFGKGDDADQKNTETSLIERFVYPKYGPGQMWEEVARRVRELGGEILVGYDAHEILTEGFRIRAVRAKNERSGELRLFEGDYFFSTMPIKELVRKIDQRVPDEIRLISEGLVYRDFITVGLLLKELKIKESNGGLIKDNWIYVQEPDVSVGRIQIFNNWSPYMVSSPSNVWIGLEYFCSEGDELWKKMDEQMIEFAAEELSRIGFIEASGVLDATVIRVPKTYPAYFGTYDRFDVLRRYLNSYENLFLIGRNGMHKYNNADHSMLTAMVAVDNIIEGRMDKSNIWAVNTEQEYYEDGSGAETPGHREGS